MNKRSLRFHVRSNDLFGTVATVVDLLRQDAEKSGYHKAHSRVLARVRDALVYLQQKHRIVESGKGLKRPSKKEESGRKAALFV